MSLKLMARIYFGVKGICGLQTAIVITHIAKTPSAQSLEARRVSTQPDDGYFRQYSAAVAALLGSSSRPSIARPGQEFGLPGCVGGICSTRHPLSETIADMTLDTPRRPTRRRTLQPVVETIDKAYESRWHIGEHSERTTGSSDPIAQRDGYSTPTAYVSATAQMPASMLPPV